jgi:hypothetical protein
MQIPTKYSIVYLRMSIPLFYRKEVKDTMKFHWSKEDGLTIELSWVVVAMILSLIGSAVVYGIAYVTQLFA